MVLIPADSFSMGSHDSQADEDERPIHAVTLGAFLMDNREVTVARFRLFCTETGRAFPRQPPWSAEDHPVVNVTWDDAAAYCRWAGKRLPTEAEWEMAARGGTVGRLFPWGETFECAAGNFDDETRVDPFTVPGGAGCDKFVETAPVGSFPPNEYDLYDMVGNVWEWCFDWHGKNYYGKSPKKNPTGPATGEYRTVRGGSWANPLPKYFRLSARNWHLPDTRSDCIGFRCAATPP
jgi:formylglycine-generating enzyme required for sulfatase activity